MDPVGVSIALACGAAMYAFVWHRQRMEGPDGQVLPQLKAAGSDLRRPHEIDLFFTGSKRGLAALKDRLSSRGYQTTLSELDPPANGHYLRATVTTVPRLSSLLRLRREMCSIATAHESAYDGWGASVVSRGNS